MFCQKCGREIPDDSTFCPGCGAQVNMAQPSVMSIYAANQIKVTGEKGNVFAVLGIIFGAAFTLYGLLCVFLLLGLLGAYGSVLGYYLNLL